LPARIIYGWTDLHSTQLKSGEDYGALQPTYAVWLLEQTLLHDIPGYAHAFRMRDEQGWTIWNHRGIWLLELSNSMAGLSTAS